MKQLNRKHKQSTVLRKKYALFGENYNYSFQFVQKILIVRNEKFIRLNYIVVQQELNQISSVVVGRYHTCTTYKFRGRIDNGINLSNLY